MPMYAYKDEFAAALLKALNLEDKAHTISRIVIDVQAYQPVSVHLVTYPDLEAPEQLTGVLAMLLKPEPDQIPDQNLGEQSG